MLELKSAGRRGRCVRSDCLAIHLQVISLGLLDLVPLVEQLARTVVLAGVFADLHHQVLLRQLLLPLRRARLLGGRLADEQLHVGRHQVLYRVDRALKRRLDVPEPEQHVGDCAGRAGLSALQAEKVRGEGQRRRSESTH